MLVSLIFKLFIGAAFMVHIYIYIWFCFYWFNIYIFPCAQLSSAGIIRLPRFEMAMAKPEANSKPVLAAEDVHIVTVLDFCFPVLFHF